MKKIGFLALAGLLLTLTLSPDKPGALKAYKPELIKTISDDAGNFHFKRIRQILVSRDGHLAVFDGSGVLLFNPRGHFIKNLIKRGEGPGEVRYLSGMYFEKDRIYICGIMPAKLMAFNTAGKYLWEFRLLKSKPIVYLIGKIKDTYFFRENQITGRDVKTGINTVGYRIFSCRSDGKIIGYLPLVIDTKSAVIKIQQEGRTLLSMTDITRLIGTFDTKSSFYFSHEERYGIKKLDLDTGKITASFKAPYDPVDYYPSGEKEDSHDIKLRKMINARFFVDIKDLVIDEKQLWVITSRVVKGRGVHIDSFDLEGKLRDRFFLKLPGVNDYWDLKDKTFCLRADTLWVGEKDEEENPLIGIYRVVK